MRTNSQQAPLLPLSPHTRSWLALGHDDLHQHLIIRGRVPPLGHLEYLLARSLLVQYQEWEAGCSDHRTVSAAVLRQETGARSPLALYRLVSDVRSKLSPFGLQIKMVLGEGYFLDQVPDW